MTAKKRRIEPAPSIAAASCSSFGTVCRPARSITIIQGKLAQVLVMMTASIAVPGWPSQATDSSMRPAFTRTPLSTP